MISFLCMFIKEEKEEHPEIMEEEQEIRDNLKNIRKVAAGLSLPYGKSHTNHDRYTTTAAKQTKPIWLIFFRRRNVQIQKGGSRMSRLY